MHFVVEMKILKLRLIGDNGRKQDGKIDKEIRTMKMYDSNDFYWDSSDIDKYIHDEKSTRKSRKGKKVKKRVIIIEEY